MSGINPHISQQEIQVRFIYLPQLDIVYSHLLIPFPAFVLPSL
jgi:hypothetical protein